MKRSIAFLVATLFSTAAMCADVVATITVKRDDQVVYRITNEFIGLTDVEAASLRTTGTKQLDYAARQQDKGGNWSMTWKWNDAPEIETAGMKFQAVTATLYQGSKWIEQRALNAHEKAKQGKKGPWGN